MKKTNCLFTLWVVALCAGARAYAVGTAPAILSNYGEIQSVTNYSSNPFWNKNSPYNQNFPKPIYATGADLNTGDCNRVVENLIASYCTEHNYCRNLRISDVRPTVMVQLSQLPGHNFATSCGGYIDSAFTKFQKEYGNTSTVNLPKQITQGATIETANPFAQKPTATQAAVADRTAELERLQTITTPSAGIQATDFPKTTADLSFTDRLANAAAGYEQYQNLESYKKPDFLGEDEEFFNRLKTQNFEEYCKRRPENAECVKWYCEQNPDDEKCKKTTPTTPVTPPVNPPITPPNTNCPDAHMTINPTTGKCECTGKYAPKPGDPNTCICADPNLDITTNDTCDSIPQPISGPQCLIKMSQDPSFMNTLKTKLASLSQINVTELKNKLAYADIAQAVHNFCVDSDSASSTDFMDFNNWIDSNATLPILIPFNTGTTTIEIDAEDLFNYIDYSYDVLLVQKNTSFTPQKTVTRKEINLVPESEECANYYTSSRGTAYSLNTTPAIRKAAESVYGNTVYNLNNSSRYSFPGKLLHASAQHPFNPWPVRINNYIIARKNVKQFVTKLNAFNGCSGHGMAVFLINDKTTSRNGQKVDEVTIKSEPFVIQ